MGFKRANRVAFVLGCVTLSLILHSCLGQDAPSVQSADAQPAAAAAAGPAGPATAATTSQYNHKSLIPLEVNDVLLFIVIGVALFIASGAGVGGGVLVVPALLIISQFNAIVSVALSNVTILSSAVANMLFNIPRHSPYRPGPLIDWDLVLLLGPPTVVGSIAGSYINMVIPSWVTKVTLFLLVLPMTWRMIEKAKLLYSRENAARCKAAAEAAAEAEATIPAAALSQQQTQASAANTCSSLGPDLEACASVVGPLPNLQPSALAHGTHHPEAYPLVSPGASSNPLHRVSSTPLSRISATLSSMAHSTIGDAYGPDLEYLGSEAGDNMAVVEGSLPPQAGESTAAAAAVAATNGVSGPTSGCDQAGVRTAGLQKDVLQQEPAAAPAAAQHVRVPRWLHPKAEGLHTSPELCAAVQAKVHAEEVAQLPLLQTGLLVSILVGVAATNITGGYLLDCGSWQWWLLMLSPLPLMVIVWAVVRQHVLWKAGWKKFLGMKEVGDLKWDRKSTVVYPAMCISAGIIAGMLGLGGGLVLAPMMLELGVQPATSVASTQVTLLISSSTSAIVYAVADSIPWDYGVVLVVIGFLATLLGQWLINLMVKKLKRNSILVIILAAMFAMATAAALAVVVMTVIDIVRHPAKLTARKAVCPTFN